METIRLNIKRDKSATGCAMSYRIVVGGKEVTKLRIGKEFSMDIPNAQTTLKVSMVGNSFTFHKIEKEVVVFPQNCKSGVIDCLISTKMNMLGVMTFGLIQAVGRAEIQVNYS